MARKSRCSLCERNLMQPSHSRNGHIIVAVEKDFEQGYQYFREGEHDPEMEHRHRVTMQVNRRLELRSTLDPFAVSVTEFKKLYRLPQHLVFELANILSDYIVEGVSANVRSIPLEIKVLCALAFYSSGSYQGVIGHIAELSQCQASVSNSISQVTRALNNPAVLARFIHFPSTRAEREETIQRNAALGMPRVLGFIDGTLVRIVPPRMDENREVYYCRKGYTALNVQIVCDADLYIMNVNARYPGACNDPFLFRFTLRDEMRRAYRESRCWLLGDSIYALEPWLHIPILRAPAGSPEDVYTQLHCHCRNAVERCIGVLKGRWRCLIADRTLHYSPEKAGLIVNACVVLHNFCRQRRIHDPRPLQEPRDSDDEEEVEDEGLAVDGEGAHIRALANRERGFLIEHAVAGRRRNRLH